jgi:hypothetical protein
MIQFYKIRDIWSCGETECYWRVLCDHIKSMKIYKRAIRCLQECYKLFTRIRCLQESYKVSLGNYFITCPLYGFSRIDVR